MPLRKIVWTHPESGWALWHIRETERELTVAEPCPADITSPVKRIEWQAGRMLVQLLAEQAHLPFEGIYKDDRGKPFLRKLPHHISLSHSYPYVAAQLSANRLVGIDIEQPGQKLRRIAHRVFAAQELADAGDNLTKNCIYWCAKEALYKIYGKKGLSFIEHLTITPFVLAAHGTIEGRIRRDGFPDPVVLRYFAEEDYVLVLTKDEA